VDAFWAAVTLAARIAAKPESGSIVAANAVRVPAGAFSSPTSPILDPREFHRDSDPMQGTSTGHRRTGVHLTPRTRLGFWAVRLLIAFAALFLTISALVASGQRGVWLVSLVIPLFVSGLLAAATAAVAVVRRGERSVLVFLPLAVGILIAFFLVGELIGHD
jgi:hypothetical protein